MKETINEKNFDEILEGTEKTGWEAFKLAIYNFVGRHTDSSLGQCLEPTE